MGQLAKMVGGLIPPTVLFFVTFLLFLGVIVLLLAVRSLTSRAQYLEEALAEMGVKGAALRKRANFWKRTNNLLVSSRREEEPEADELLGG